MPNKIAIITLCIGPDYIKAMEPLLESKRNYANKHGYDFIIGGKDVWDRHRPVQWSKFNIIQKHIHSYDWIFWTDADSIILNDTIKLETFIDIIPPNKDILWTIDACNHMNNGHMFIRGKSAWAHDFFNRAYSQTQYLHHIWWDNAAMIDLYKTHPTDYLKIETITTHWLFNAYIFGLVKLRMTQQHAFINRVIFLSILLAFMPHSIFIVWQNIYNIVQKQTYLTINNF